jgi:hypothetical protein
MHARLVLISFVAMCLALAACSNNEDSSPPTSATSVPTQTAADATASLSNSPDRLAAVTSARTTYEWEITRDDFHIRGDGVYRVRQPGDAHLDAHYRGEGEVPSKFQEANDSELLVLGQSVYLKTPPLGNRWVLFTPAEFGADWDALQRLAAQRSALNYRGAVAGATDVAAAGADEIDGRDYTHLTGTVDANTLMKALADAYGTQGLTMLVDRFSGPIPVEIWLDPSTSLPRRLHAEGEFTYLRSDASLDLTIDFVDLNAEQDLPAAPVDAVPIAELGAQ